MSSQPWLDWAKRIQALAQAGLTYTKNEYDIERYDELMQISMKMMAELTDSTVDKVEPFFVNEYGYPTPKLDVRGVVFRDGKLLLVKEKWDGCWALPGGWADIGYSPGEIAVKETKEEAGLDVVPVKLLAVIDKKNHPHPPEPFYIYKIFILCDIVGGDAAAGLETLDVGFFAEDDLPPLSTPRNTENQLHMLFDFLRNPDMPVILE